MNKTGWIHDGIPTILGNVEQAPTGRIPRHRFSGEIDSELAALRKLDNWHGPLALITDWAVVVLAALACEALRTWSGWAFWPVYLLVALPVIGTRQRALATLLHESAHGILAKHKRLNTFLGTYPSGYLIFQSYRAYRRSHVRDHHGSFGDPRRDPDLRAHISAGLYRPQRGAAFTWKFLIAPLFGKQTPAVLRELVVARLSGTKEEVLRGAAVIAYVAGICGLFAVFGMAEVFALYWLVPLLVVFPVVNWYIEMLEHFPLVGSADLDVRTTRHRALGRISRHFLGIHNEGYHLDHHLSPKIPYWNLPAAHRARLRDPVFARAIAEIAPVGKGISWQFRDMVHRVDAGQATTRLGRFTDLDSIDAAEPSSRT
ncbi:fatty acid desaturase [Saccharopolyspora sp. NPDC002578]